MAGEDILDGLMPAAAQPQQQGAPAPQAAAPAGGNADILDNIMPTNVPNEKDEDRPDHAAIAKAHTALHGTRFQEAAPKTPDDTQKWAATPWSEVGKQAIQNAIPSTWEAAKSIGHAVAPWNWGEDASAVGSLAGGIKSKAMGAFGAQQDPEQKKKNESVLDALMNHYASVYGTEGGFKKALATDPASMAMDASTFAGGAGAAAKVAGLPRIAKIASIASKATDPIANSLRVAKAATALPMMGVRGAQSLTTGVPYKALSAAAMAGASDNPELRSAFMRHYTGSAPTDEPLKAMSDAMNTHRTQTLAQLQADKRLSYANAPGAMPFGKIDAALANAKAAVTKPGRSASWKADKAAALKKAEDWVNDFKADPSLQTMANFDDLRKELGDLGWEGNNQRIKDAVSPIYGAVRQTMQDVSPEYTDVLEQTTNAMREMKDMEHSLGTSAFNKGSAMTPTLIARQLRQMKTARGRDMMSKLSEIDPRIPYMLAGVATHELAPHGLRHVAEGLAAAGGVGAFAANPAAWVPILGGGAATAAAISPKVAGGLNYLYGAVPRLANSPVGKAAYYTGRADQEQESPSAATEPPDHFKKILQIESGNKQFAGNGKPLRSPAGAIGASQIMPGTLKEAAEAAGEHPDIDRLTNDADYNTKLGKALYQKRLDEFGDPAMAAAAYNSNPATVHGAMKKAKLEGGTWRDYLPPETMKYLQKFGGGGERAARASGGRAQIDHAAEAAKLVRKAETTKNQFGKTTEPLLNVPDDHIAKALSVANASI